MRITTGKHRMGRFTNVRHLILKHLEQKNPEVVAKIVHRNGLCLSFREKDFLHASPEVQISDLENFSLLNEKWKKEEGEKSVIGGVIVINSPGIWDVFFEDEISTKRKSSLIFSISDDWYETKAFKLKPDEKGIVSFQGKIVILADNVPCKISIFVSNSSSVRLTDGWHGGKIVLKKH